MVQPRILAEGFAVAPQLERSDFAELAAAGYKTIINNRPDGEAADQLSSAEAKTLAAQAGLNYIYIPTTMRTLTPEVVDAFGQALQANPAPVLAHCLSGTRSCILWSMVQGKSGNGSLEELMESAAQGGYDLTSVRPLIEEYIHS
jgi:sulfide:quinone oxidoreductase